MSKQKDNGGPAFPTKPLGPAHGKLYDGMTLRDWLMGQCIAAAFGREDQSINMNQWETVDDALKRHWATVAKAAAIAADAMLEARK
jgi:hypothetical protein